MFFFKKKQHFMAPFSGWGSSASRLQSQYEETVYFLPLKSEKFKNERGVAFEHPPKSPFKIRVIYGAFITLIDQLLCH